MTDQTHHAVLTEEGKHKAEEELYRLRTDGRREVAEKIEAAKEMGDLSENAEYTDAKDEQAFLEARIVELENILVYAEVVDSNSVSTAVVTVGSTVTLSSAEGKRVYTIVGYNEANPAEGKISNESPVGQALVGKRVGDSVQVSTPKGAKEFTVESIG